MNELYESIEYMSNSIAIAMIITTLIFFIAIGLKNKIKEKIKKIFK